MAMRSKLFFITILFLLLIPCGAPRYILRIYNSVSTFFWFVIDGATDRYTLGVFNESNAVVILDRMKVDEKEIFLGEIRLEPYGEKYNPTGRLFFNNFYSRAPKKLELTIQSEGAHAASVYSCKLEDTQQAGCVFWASIRNNNKITCFCDSFADFSN